MSVRIDIESVFRSAFGYIGLPLPELIINQLKKSGETDNSLTNTDSEVARMAADYKWGRPMDSIASSRLGVLYRRYNSATGALEFLPISLSDRNDFRDQIFLENAVMTLANKKNIVSTQLVNADGEVNEEISIGSWDLDVKGVLVSSDGNYPEDKVQALTSMYLRRQALQIENVRTALVMAGDATRRVTDREQVIIVDLEFPPVAGFENTQPYRLRMKQDINFKLFID